jgi:(2Fe-2S) ferredoxin
MPPPYLRHVFVCHNERPPDDPRGCCLARGGEAVREAFKRELKARNLARTIRANKAGCLDACEHGVSIVCYPREIWYAHVTLADVDEIVERTLLRGEPVERLLAPARPSKTPVAAPAPAPGSPPAR